MRLYLLLIFLLFSAISVAQDTTSIKAFQKQLSLNEMLVFGNKAIKFKELISDSRCPKDPQVNCIWAGEAKVLVEVFDHGELCGTEILTVATGPVLPDFLQNLIPGQQIFLNAPVLSPYPSVSRSIKPEEYRLNLQVEVMEGK